MKSLAYRFPPLPAKFSNTTPEQYLDRLIDVCKEYEWLIDALAFDIFTHNYWGKFPAEWTEALMSYVDEAGDDRCACAVLELTSKEADYSRWPTSLKAYLETIRDLPLPRDVLNEKENERPNIRRRHFVCY
ncbi:hypothetical protein BDF20DRAFT_850792 [Mycotypha africana]|uniref:uncharacterized protein n=1 Tax=Mycotypha africana TaxID=64632 RepID=UPI0023005A78|nr:uncharacterized protein BDF20DRAFT_850792 [Mycotypha africana]KAI8987537.1 hypothetical protein BDF20DRAFT_850792 [Mycotypha africana]